MSEEKLQSDIAVAFSQRYPNKRGQLFHVSNERNNKIQAYRAKAIGIVAGVADFVFFSENFNVATELKVPGSRHEVEHIKTQMWWGEIWEKQGGIWRLCRTVEEAMSCYEGDFKGLTLGDLNSYFKNYKKRTIIF